MKASRAANIFIQNWECIVYQTIGGDWPTPNGD
jgi:hypothetical protein